MPKEQKASIRPQREGAELTSVATGKRVRQQDLVHDRNVILIHGFTAHGSYLTQLSSDLYENGFNPILFNFNSYEGIEKAANNLFALLDGLNELSKDLNQRVGVFDKNKVSLVCHSMGGLVARALTFNERAIQFLKNIVTLGTPHCGTLQNSDVVDILIELGEFLTEEMPGFTSPEVTSLAELTRKDGCPSILERLLKKNALVDNLPILSISGGRPILEVSDSPRRNWVANKILQSELGKQTNDGLVAEISSSLSQDIFSDCLPNRRHYNGYPEFKNLNHTYLIRNQNLNITIMRWLANPNLDLSTLARSVELNEKRF